MNNSYVSYVSYVESTDYYKKLSSALSRISNISDNIDTLINALKEPNGTNITEAITDLRNFKAKLDKISKYYKSLIKSLKDNAEQYDKLYKKLNVPFPYIPIYYFDSYQVLNPKVTYNFFDNFNFDVHIASKTLKEQHTCISSDSGYIGYIKVENINRTIKYRLKNSILNTTFDIESGTPEDCWESYPISSVDTIIYYYNKDKANVESVSKSGSGRRF